MTSGRVFSLRSSYFFVSLYFVNTSVILRVCFYMLRNSFCVNTSHAVQHKLLENFVTKSAAVLGLPEGRLGLSMMTFPVTSQVPLEDQIPQASVVLNVPEMALAGYPGQTTVVSHPIS